MKVKKRRPYWEDASGSPSRIRCCHAKDIRCVDTLADKNVCLMLEHMTEEADYIEATKYIKGVAARVGVTL